MTTLRYFFTSIKVKVFLQQAEHRISNLLNKPDVFLKSNTISACQGDNWVWVLQSCLLFEFWTFAKYIYVQATEVCQGCELCCWFLFCTDNIYIQQSILQVCCVCRTKMWYFDLLSWKLGVWRHFIFGSRELF